MIFYHGGIAGLPIGGFILPAVEVGPPEWNYEDEATKAYVTTDLRVAWKFALSHERGDGEVYLVQPIGRLELDDSYDEGKSDTVFACDKARILARSAIPCCVREAWKAGEADAKWGMIWGDHEPVEAVER